MDYNYNAYEILGLDTNATREEVEQRYKQLREKYQKDRFLPGEAGEDASENLQRIEVAYRDILASMEESTQTEDLRQEDDYTEIQQLIKENKLYGRIVCRCENVTEGEIVDAIHRTPGAVDLDGLKRRTRAGMGRCQAGFCTPRLMEILARETGKSMTEITKKGTGSELLVGKTKGEEL